jgi:outer membrane protein OmpA-like peptidoglycan-associated protein
MSRYRIRRSSSAWGRRLTRHFALAGAALLASGSLPARADRAACEAAQSAAATAVETRHIEDFDRLASALDACQAAEAREARMAMARAVASEAVRRMRQDRQTLAQQREAIDQALKLGGPWEALALACDLHHSERQHSDAQVACERALMAINDPELTPNPPRREVIERLYKLAEASRLAAGHYEPSPRTRAGEPTGLASLEFRGFVPKKVALPIWFEFDSTIFTPDGGRAALDLAAMVKQQRLRMVHLIGHTDYIGNDSYNDQLSLARAEAVKYFLCQTLATCMAGLSITTEGHGKREPFQPYDAEQFTPDQLRQMSRRVEMERQ